MTTYSDAAMAYANSRWYAGSHEWEKAAEAYDADAGMRSDLAARKIDLDVIRALGYDVVTRAGS